MGNARHYACAEADGLSLWQSCQRYFAMVCKAQHDFSLLTVSRYVKTKILSDEDFANVRKLGVEFAELEDAGRCLLRILSDSSVNGHSFFLSARKWASSGFVDFDIDDYPESSLIQEIQFDQMRGGPANKGLFV